jgi:hypothetical protein
MLQPVAEALIAPEDIRREREHDRTHDAGGRLRLERSTGRLPPNRAGVNSASSILTPANSISSAGNLAEQLADLADAIAALGTGYAWSVLTNGYPADPQIIFTAEGDVIMTEVDR